ncbi:hypothetical protein [Methylobacterium dankookense]|uniref:Lipoprotein n=1 Tax=Methylobacterium dankookense TaxID=560405 RepID=A0A564FWI7_9HYPH|nr:hypothetical protein [Methylobacterium dankookense]GJD56408.1 hypothetical protein IFDJLNFL_2304 [Methylobacterium dankookense]VUF12525.1 hypothetical protein MTDSW087_02217 [Methylobacterium dankookense]
MPLSPLNPALRALGARPRRAVLLAVCLAALGGCQSVGGGLGQILGGGGGVMPAGDVGPPPSLRGSVPTRTARADVDPDAGPPATAPTRRLDLPKNVRGETRAEAPAERRIRREELEGSAGGGSSSGGMAPALTPSGGMGVGGRF